MPLYGIMGTTAPDKLKAQIDALYPVGRSYFVPPNHWFVIDDLPTAQLVAEKIGLKGTSPAFGGIVLNVAGYWGFADGELWPWLAKAR